jgi:hypothetical protein
MNLGNVLNLRLFPIFKIIIFKINVSKKAVDSMLLPLLCTPEECVDFDIKIGLLSKDERQTIIDNLYRGASEILSEMENGT